MMRWWYKAHRNRTTGLVIGNDGFIRLSLDYVSLGQLVIYAVVDEGV